MTRVQSCCRLLQKTRISQRSKRLPPPPYFLLCKADDKASPYMRPGGGTYAVSPEDFSYMLCFVGEVFFFLSPFLLLNSVRAKSPPANNSQHRALPIITKTPIGSRISPLTLSRLFSDPHAFAISCAITPIRENSMVISSSVYCFFFSKKKKRMRMSAEVLFVSCVRGRWIF